MLESLADLVGCNTIISYSACEYSVLKLLFSVCVCTVVYVCVCVRVCVLYGCVIIIDGSISIFELCIQLIDYHVLHFVVFITYLSLKPAIYFHSHCDNIHYVDVPCLF